MKMLLSTTALAMVLGLPTLVLAQTAPQASGQQTGQAAGQTQQQQGEMQGFMSMRGQSDLFVSELIGHDVYARRTGDQAGGQMGGQAGTRTDTQAGGQAGTQAGGQAGGQMGGQMGGQGGNREMARMNRADLDQMDMIGQINEIVLSSDGEVRALVIGVGGFMGMGERDVAVTMDQVHFSVDAEDPSQMYVVVATSADRLEGSPEYDRTQPRQDHAQGAGAAGGMQTQQAQTQQQPQTQGAAGAGNQGQRTPFTAPQLEREGYERVVVSNVSADMLTGHTVYSVNDENVGTIDDLIIDDSGAITNVIIDFGGFLGFGTSQVSVGFEELTILSNVGSSDVRVYIDATREQIQGQPQYRAAGN